MEGERSGSSSSKRKALRDCTNHSLTKSSPQKPKGNSSSSPILKPTNFLIKYSTTEPTTAPSAASTPPRPLNSSSVAGISSDDPHSVYRRRSSADKRSKGKAVAVPSSCFPSLKTQFTRDEMTEVGFARPSKSQTEPRKKKQRRTTSSEDSAQHTLSQDFIKQQRAYFAEIDAFELPEEEVASVDELD